MEKFLLGIQLGSFLMFLLLLFCSFRGQTHDIMNASCPLFIAQELTIDLLFSPQRKRESESESDEAPPAAPQLTKKEKKKNKKDKKAKAMQESGGEPGDEVHINTGSLKGWLI
jgi:hypothetical protein